MPAPTCRDCRGPIQWTKSTAAIVWIIVLSVLFSPLFGISLFGLLFLIGLRKLPKCLVCGRRPAGIYQPKPPAPAPEVVQAAVTAAPLGQAAGNQLIIPEPASTPKAPARTHTQPPAAVKPTTVADERTETNKTAVWGFVTALIALPFALVPPIGWFAGAAFTVAAVGFIKALLNRTNRGLGLAIAGVCVSLTAFIIWTAASAPSADAADAADAGGQTTAAESTPDTDADPSVENTQTAVDTTQPERTHPEKADRNSTPPAPAATQSTISTSTPAAASADGTDSTDFCRVDYQTADKATIQDAQRRLGVTDDGIWGKRSKKAFAETCIDPSYSPHVLLSIDISQPQTGNVMEHTLPGVYSPR